MAKTPEEERAAALVADAKNTRTVLAAMVVKAEAGNPASDLAAQLESAEKRAAAFEASMSAKDVKLTALEKEKSELTAANEAFDSANVELDRTNSNLRGQITVLKSGQTHTWLGPLIISIVALGIAFLALLTKK